MDENYIENSINILINENSSNEEINKIFNEMINYFNRDRIYIALFELVLKKKKNKFIYNYNKYICYEIFK